MEDTGKQLVVSKTEIISLIKKTSKSNSDLERMDSYFSNVKFFKDCKNVLTNEQYFRILKSIEYDSLKKN